MRDDINRCADKETRKELKNQRNQIIGQIHHLVNKSELSEITELVNDIENNKDDSSKMFKAVKVLQNFTPKNLSSSTKKTEAKLLMTKNMLPLSLNISKKCFKSTQPKRYQMYHHVK